MVSSPSIASMVQCCVRKSLLRYVTIKCHWIVASKKLITSNCRNIFCIYSRFQPISVGWSGYYNYKNPPTSATVRWCSICQSIFTLSLIPELGLICSHYWQVQGCYFSVDQRIFVFFMLCKKSENAMFELHLTVMHVIRQLIEFW